MCKASGVIGLGTPKNALVYQTSLGWRLVQERVALVYETTLGGCWYTKRSFPVRNYLAMTVGIQEERSVYGLYVGIHSSNASLRAA